MVKYLSAQKLVNPKIAEMGQDGKIKIKQPNAMFTHEMVMPM